LEQSSEQNAQKTVLVVDDTPQVLEFVASVLKGRDLNLLLAGNGADALQLSQEYDGEIHLLLSDFQMPGMNGMELASAITVKRPRLQVLLMSGFNAGMLVLNEGWHFLPKPFIPSTLRAIVMTLISSDRASQFVEYPLPDKQS
jgi:two-component system cell cycle sensor histidine kinase/response regulator CckA